MAADHFSMPYNSSKRKTLPEQGYGTNVFHPFAPAKRDVLDLTRAYALQDGGVALAHTKNAAPRKSNISKQLEKSKTGRHTWHTSSRRMALYRRNFMATATIEENATTYLAFKIQKNTWAGVEGQLLEFFQ